MYRATYGHGVSFPASLIRYQRPRSPNQPMQHVGLLIELPIATISFSNGEDLRAHDVPACITVGLPLLHTSASGTSPSTRRLHWGILRETNAADGAMSERFLLVRPQDKHTKSKLLPNTAPLLETKLLISAARYFSFSGQFTASPMGCKQISRANEVIPAWPGHQGTRWPSRSD